jgi:hypothetical protein
MPFFDKLKSWLGIAPARADEGADLPEAPPAPIAVQPAAKQRVSPAPTPPAPRKPPKRRTTAQEDGRIEADARERLEAGDPAGALSILREQAVLLAKHEPTTLPCLCAECIDPSEDTAESGGISYVRDFVVTRHRALVYWMPAELTDDAKQVRASMRGAVRSRLRALAQRPDEAYETINPFTKQRVTVPARQRRHPIIDPFTGKPVP